MSNSTQNDEIKQMERAIDEGFAESERDLKNRQTPLDTPTQNDEIEVDGETYVKWDTQNDWEKRFYDKFPCLMHFRPNKRSYGYSEVGDDVKEFIAKELADARREVYLEIEEKVMECKKDITKYQNTTDILHKTITKHEKAWINSGFRLALESLDKLQKFVVLATLRKEGV